MVVGLDDHGHVVGAGIFTQFAQTRGHSGLGLVAGSEAFVGLRLAPKHAHIRCFEGCGQIDEAAGVCQLFCPLSRILHIQLCRAAHAGNLQLAGTDFFFRLLNPVRSEEGIARASPIFPQDRAVRSRRIRAAWQNPESFSIPMRDNPAWKMPAGSGSVSFPPPLFQPRPSAPAWPTRASSEIDVDCSSRAKALPSSVCRTA